MSYQFGWKPLLSDLRKLINFQSIVDKRAQEIKRLYSKGGLKRRMSLYTSQRSAKSSSVVESSCGRIFNATVESNGLGRAWATIRWKPTKLPPVINDETSRQQAFKAAFGIGLEAADVWNLVPWSWLVDWFSSTGDYLAAHANKIPASPGDLNVMVHERTVRQFTRTNNLNISGGNATITYETKKRFIGGGPGITATLPFLSGRQLSILGSLAILRGRRR